MSKPFSPEDTTHLADDVKWLLLEGGSYLDAPDLGASVLDLVQGFTSRFLSLPGEHARTAHTLWCAHTWLMPCWEHTPRLLFVSPEAACGKTRSLIVTKHLVPRADHVADLTPAALYHSIDEAMKFKGGRPTILFDEFDTVFGTAESGNRKQNEDMRRLINAGHDRSERVIRKIGKSTKRFQVFSPMALAGKMAIYDVPETVRSRSITIPMQRRKPGEEIERWVRRESVVEAELLRWLLQCWAELVHPYALEYVRPGYPVLPKEIEDRDADCWEPLLALAEIAGGDWPERAQRSSVAHVAQDGVKATPSEGIELLTDIQSIFEKRQVKVIFTAELLDELTKLDSRWRRFNGRKLARLLHSYGVRETNRDQRISGVVKKGYRAEYFVDAWSRYLPPRATSATSAQSATDRSGNGD
ncbi:hypothetical protein MINTM020_44740 [Mycobacterium paraintracellulare]|uniref:DUF3631 domain-containing protein n=1 Tax=Mycobacterium paraintracellulare TaxID=1138383 RepID=UPI001925AADF|nr:DUF3631 domain-containing protein [Mycobacterium paraintracellulare]BCP12376.1 hypothetical protein MINTM020_44740 [Mycobacterium paraintracellulare]